MHLKVTVGMGGGKYVKNNLLGMRTRCAFVYDGAGLSKLLNAESLTRDPITIELFSNQLTARTIACT